MKKLLVLFFLLMATTVHAADTKVSALTELATTPAASDEFYINDGGTSKKIQYSNIMAGEATTAAALAANPAAATAGSCITNIAANGDVEAEVDVWTEAENTSAAYAPLTAPTFETSITGNYLTASEIVITDASKNIVSGAVATYPSLAELAWLKGMTSKVIDDDQIDTFAELQTIVADETLLKAGTLTDTKYCIYDSASTDIICNSAGGSGGGATNLTLPVQSAKITGAFVVFTPPTADACTAGAAIDASQGNWRLLFDDTIDNCATWQFVMPDNYASDPIVNVHFSMLSGESDEVQFEAAIMCYTPTTDTVDVGTASFSNVAVGTTTVSATAGEMYKQTITLTDDSCAAGDIVWIVISTDADDAANDDATGDREVVAVELTFT